MARDAARLQLEFRKIKLHHVTYVRTCWCPRPSRRRARLPVYFKSSSKASGYWYTELPEVSARSESTGTPCPGSVACRGLKFSLGPWVRRVIRNPLRLTRMARIMMSWVTVISGPYGDCPRWTRIIESIMPVPGLNNGHNGGNGLGLGLYGSESMDPGCPRPPSPFKLPGP